MTPKGPERHRLEVQFLSEHGHHARYLLLLTVARVIGPGLKVGCHHVIDSGENLHDFQLLPMLIENAAECLNEPRPPTWISPRIVTCGGTKVKDYIRLIW